jgi:hypothetical protein
VKVQILERGMKINLRALMLQTTRLSFKAAVQHPSSSLSTSVYNRLPPFLNNDLFSGQMSTIPVFVTLGGGQPVIVHIAHGAFVGDLVDAAIVKLKLVITADMVTLRFAPSEAGEPGAVLDAFARLAAAGVREESRLVIKVIDAPPVGACTQGELSFGLPAEGVAVGGDNDGCSHQRLPGAWEGLYRMGQGAADVCTVRSAPILIFSCSSPRPLECPTSSLLLL